MPKPSQSYDPEFKKQLVRLRVEEGRTYPSISEEYGVCKATLRNWVDRYGEECEPAPSLAKEEDLLNENKRLRKALEEKDKEVRFLKKAAAFFAKEQD